MESTRGYPGSLLKHNFATHNVHFTLCEVPECRDGSIRRRLDVELSSNSNAGGDVIPPGHALTVFVGTTGHKHVALRADRNIIGNVGETCSMK